MLILLFLSLISIELFAYLMFHNRKGSWVYNVKKNFIDDKITILGFIFFFNVAISLFIFWIYRTMQFFGIL